MPLPVVPPVAVQPKFRRMPGRAPRLGWNLLRRTSSLWLGADELVQIDTVVCKENTRRFAYADIQALMLRETPRGLIQSGVGAALAGVFGLLAWGMDGDVGRNVLATVAGFFLLLLIYNVARGGTCRCVLQTASGPHALPSLNRRRPARRALRLIAEQVEGRQTDEG